MRLAQRVLLSVALVGSPVLTQSARSRKGAAASSAAERRIDGGSGFTPPPPDTAPSRPPPAPPPTPKPTSTDGGLSGTTTTGSEVVVDVVLGSPVDYDLIYAIDDDSLEDLQEAIENGALVNGCESTELAYRTGLYKQVNDLYYVPNKIHERVWDSMRVVEGGMTPLHYLLLRSIPLLRLAKPQPVWPGPPNLVLMRELLESGASPNLQTDRSGRTSLMLAAAFGFDDAVELLLEFGAKVDTHSKWGDRDAAEWATVQSHKGALGGHGTLARHLRDPHTIKAALERNAATVAAVASAGAVTTEHGCVCKAVWDDDDDRTFTGCPPSEKWCEVEPGCEAAKEKDDDYDGWDECSPFARKVRDEL